VVRSALWIVAVGSLVTLIQRVVTVRRESAEVEAAEAEAAGSADAAEGKPENASRGSEAAK
jgi:CDP-diacylglycerol---glycerol-3-phosphate 3-phosphatidyltransferase